MLKVAKVAPGCSTDGQEITLTVVDAAGSAVTIAADAKHANDLYLALEEAAYMAREHQRASIKGLDPRAFFPVNVKTVTALGGAVSTDGTPVLDIEINGKMRMSLALKPDDLRALIEWLERLEGDSQAEPSKPS